MRDQTVHFVGQIPDLGQLGNNLENYQHSDKLVTPGRDLSLANAYLKWYNISHREVTMSSELIQEGRTFLQAEVAASQLNLDGQFGFVELHHCTSVAFLLVATWNNENELWEAPYVKDLAKADGFRPVEAGNGNHRPIYCVWELAPVWHERQAWVRYLRSARDEEAKYAYLNDRFSGPC